MNQHNTMARKYLSTYLVTVTILCTTEVLTIPLMSSSKTVKFKPNGNHHDNQQPHPLLRRRSDFAFLLTNHFNDSIFRNRTSSNDFGHLSSENLSVAGILHFDTFMNVCVKSRPRNITSLMYWTPNARTKTSAHKLNESPDDKDDPRLPISLRTGQCLSLNNLYKSRRHMFSHHSYPFNGTGQCHSSSYLCRHWLYNIANFYRYLLSRMSNFCSSYFREFRRCILSRLDGSGVFKILLTNVAVIAGFCKLGKWFKPPARPSRGLFGLEVAVNYGRPNRNSQPTMKSWRCSATSLLEPLHFLIRPRHLKSHSGFQEDCKTEPSTKEGDCWDNGSDADGSSYLKQFYTSTSRWQPFRPERAQVRVAPIQRPFLPNPTLNPNIDLAYLGYRIATLGALPASFPVSLFKLAEAGFYFQGQGDEMTCYKCGARHSGWTSRDDPIKVHRALAPRCGHVIATDSETQGLAGGAANTAHSAAHAPVEGGLDDGQGSEQRQQSAARSSSSASFSFSSPQWTGRMTSQPAANGTGGQGLSTPGASLNGQADGGETEPARPIAATSGASLNGHIGSSTTETTRPSIVISRASMNGHSGSSHQPAANTRPSSASQPTRTVAQASTVTVIDGASEAHLFPRAGLDLGQAVYPMYQNTASRRRSFEHCRWDDSRAPPLEEVIMSGMFYAGYADCVRCFYCGVGLKHWLPSDDVWKEHVRWRPHCGYLRTIRTEAFFEDMQRQLDAAGSGETQHAARSSSASHTASHGRPSASTITITNNNSTTTTTTAAATPATTSTTTTTSNPQTRQPAGTGRCAQVSASGTFSADSQTATRQAPPPSSASAVLQTQETSAPSPSISASSGTSSSTTTTTTTTTTATTSRNPAAPASEPATPRGSSASSSSTAARSESSGRTVVAPVGGASSSDGPGGAGDGSHGNQRGASNEVAVADAAGDAEGLERLREENHRQSQRLQCQVCRQSRVGAIFLPCGHLVACEACAQTLASCPLCHVAIRATARVFMT